MPDRAQDTQPKVVESVVGAECVGFFGTYRCTACDRHPAPSCTHACAPPLRRLWRVTARGAWWLAAVSVRRMVSVRACVPRGAPVPVMKAGPSGRSAALTASVIQADTGQ